jgi:hypothetical protein
VGSVSFPSARFYDTHEFMAKSIADTHKKRRGRPKTTGTTPLVGVRLAIALQNAVANWADSQPDKPTRAEAIRRLVELGLSVSRQRSKAKR